MKYIFQNLKYDLSASIVVFFVALPLCLGIALASGAPLFSGIISGIVGGIVVGLFSGSRLGVSGPAAGLSVITLGYTAFLGSWQAFLLSVVIMGIIQIISGFLKWGTIAYFFPSSVIKGMLSGIGLLIALKQLPYITGLDPKFSIFSLCSQNCSLQSFSANLTTMFHSFAPGVILISIISLLILILWENKLTQSRKILRIIPAPLLAVVTGIILYNLFQNDFLPFKLTAQEVVRLPVSSSFNEFAQQFMHPDFSQLYNPNIYIVGFLMALVASLETLLCVEATDKLDPSRRITPANRELKAQGLGNIISGLIGGLPITQVIVRSSANITFGGKTKISTISHGFLLLVCVISIPKLLNMIPMATLASILIVVGYNLSRPSLFKRMYGLGWQQFMPFLTTILGILLLDLLKGVAMGLIAALAYILRDNLVNSCKYTITQANENEHIIELSEEVSFLNKGGILQTLGRIPRDSKVTIDGSKSTSIDFDIIEVIRNFQTSVESRNISLTIKGINIK